MFKADDGRKRKAVVNAAPLTVGGVQVGGSCTVEYRKEDVPLGPCEWQGCDKSATIETLLGHQLCNSHFGEFMFGDET